MAIRLRVRERRQALRLSLVEVARRIGVSAAFLSQYETGKNNIGIENAKRLSIVLGIPVEELLESGVDKRPRWLDVLTERHDLSRSEQEALLSVARESPVYRGAAVLREEQNDVEHWEMVYQSIKPYLPKCGRSEDWINKSEIRNIAVGLGVPNASCLEDILCAVDKQVDKICEGIEFRNIDAFRTHMLSALGIRVERLYNDVDLTPLLREFAAMGLFRAISDCALFARDVHAFGGTYAIKNCTGENRFLVLIDERNDKMWRSEFTLWHEMAHVIADPNVMLGTVATFDEANSKDEVVSDLPFNSEKLIIEAGEHKLLWAKGENRLAPTYLNFKLNNDKPSTICLSYYDGETETLVDCIKYESHPTNGSYGREKDNDETWTIFDKCEDGKTLSSTPNTSNGKCGNVIINEVTGKSIPTLSLYPNPASDFIQLSCAEPILSCTLYNMDGAVIQRENGDVQGLDIQKYPTGIYMIEVRTLNFIYRSKFIKQ